MSLEKWLTADEGVKLSADAGLSENTFFRHARENKIRKELPEHRERGALYSGEDIRRIVGQQYKRQGKQFSLSPETPGETDWIQERDLPYVLALDLEVYGIENTVDISITHAWWKKNPYMCRILYDRNDRRNIWGVLTIIPLPEETIIRLLRDELSERDLTPEDIQVYEPGNSYYGYIPSAAVRPERRSHFRKLINSVFNFWCEQYPEIRFTKLYAFAISDEGTDLIKHLFFSPRYDISEKAFELNPYQRTPSKVLRAFQECIKRREMSLKVHQQNKPDALPRQLEEGS